MVTYQKMYFRGYYLSLDEVRIVHDLMHKYMWPLPRFRGELYLLYSYGICGYLKYYTRFALDVFTIKTVNDLITSANLLGAYNKPIPYVSRCQQLTLF